MKSTFVSHFTPLPMKRETNGISDCLLPMINTRKSRNEAPQKFRLSFHGKLRSFHLVSRFVSHHFAIAGRMGVEPTSLESALPSLVYDLPLPLFAMARPASCSHQYRRYRRWPYQGQPGSHQRILRALWFMAGEREKRHCRPPTP